MSFNVAMLKQMREEGLDFDAAIRVLEAGEPKQSSAAIRQKRYRDNKRDVTRDVTGSPKKEDNQTPPDNENSEPKGSSQKPWVLPAGVSLQVWTDLLANRKRKRLPNTPTAWKAFCDDLSRVSVQTGIPPPQLIERCAAKGWGAIYDPRDQRNDRSANPTADAVNRILGDLRNDGLAGENPDAGGPNVNDGGATRALAARGH